jgi:cobalt-zinc-cadmium efflux system membrane fusion protein
MMTKLKWMLILVISAALGCSGKQPQPLDTKLPTEAPAENTGAKISAAMAKQAGIEVATAGPAEIRETLTLYGSIKANAERQQEIRARYPGVIRSIEKRAGDSVKKGESLLTVESSESLQVYSIAAPLSGQVLERSANSGDAVDSSTTLMKVADLSTVWVEFAIFSRDLPHVRRDMTVLFNGTDAGESATAKLNYIALAGHAESHSVVGRALVDNRTGKWVPGQFVTGEVVVADVKAPVTVTPLALQELAGKTVVFVQDEQGFQQRPVEIGKRSLDAVEIIKGVAAGERYAAKNSYLIKADLLKGEAEE